MFTPQMLKLLGTGILESLYMTLVATFLAYLFGLPLGLVLSVTDKASAPFARSTRCSGFW